MKGLLMILMLSAMIFAQEDDLFEVSRGFLDGMSDFQVPDKLAKDVFTEEFILKYANAIEGMLNDFLVGYYQQAFRAQSALIRDMNSATEYLLEQSVNSTEFFDDELIRVNDLLKKLLDCLPGKIMIKVKTLPELPEWHGKILSHLGNEKLSSLFIHLGTQIDRDLFSMHSLVNGLFLSGWQKARISLNKLRDKLRNDFLNAHILPAFAGELVKINEVSQRIHNHVNSETWEAYRQFSEQINRALRSLDA